MSDVDDKLRQTVDWKTVYECGYREGQRVMLERLEDYTNHAEYCSSWDVNSFKCSCGLDKALKVED